MEMPDQIRLQNKKIRMTSQRSTILEVLKSLRTHPTADQVYEIVKKRLPKISIGTVYRNLDMLSRLGLIKKINVGTPQMRFDGRTEEHYHVVCNRCGKVEDVEINDDFDPFRKLHKAISHRTGFEIKALEINMVGICPDCVKRGNLPLED